MSNTPPPTRTIPVAISCSMVTVTVFYVLVNVAYYTMMSPAELLQSEAVAVVSGGGGRGGAGSEAQPGLSFHSLILPADVC